VRRRCFRLHGQHDSSNRRSSPLWADEASAQGAVVGRPAQALVEFALLASLLCLMAVGVVDFARVYYEDVVVGGAALEGARAAAQGAPDNNTAVGATTVTGVTTFVRNSAGPTFGPALTISVTPPQATRASTSGVGQCTPSTCIWATVTVTYQFTPFTPIVQQLVGNNITLTRSVSQRMRSPCVLPDGSACT
jgi:Flp pilus assembly protein TadG